MSALWEQRDENFQNRDLLNVLVSKYFIVHRGLTESISFYQNNIDIMISHYHLLHFVMFRAYFSHISVISDCFLVIDQHHYQHSEIIS
jgi:hypothetical protein